MSEISILGIRLPELFSTYRVVVVSEPLWRFARELIKLKTGKGQWRPSAGCFRSDRRDRARLSERRGATRRSEIEVNENDESNRSSKRSASNS